MTSSVLKWLKRGVLVLVVALVTLLAVRAWDVHRGPVLERVRSNGSVVASLIGSTVATNVVTADQYIAIVLPGRMFKGSFEKRGLAPVVMSRALGDSATVTSALIPWNSCGAYMAATLGVATLAYAPFAFFCFLSPLVSIAYAYLGIRMLKQ